MLITNQPVQGDLIDPATGERLVVRVPLYHGGGVTRTITEQAREIDQLRQQLTILQAKVPPVPPVRVQPATRASFAAAPAVSPTSTDDTPPTGQRGVWTAAGYLAPGTF